MISGNGDDDDNDPSPIDLRLAVRSSTVRNAHTTSGGGSSSNSSGDVTSEEHLWRIVRAYDSQIARAQTLNLLKCRILERIANNQEKQLEADARLAAVLERLAERVGKR